LIVIALLFLYINDCSAVYVVNPSSNSTVARGLCKYTLNNFYYVTAWMLDYNACVQTFPNGNVDPDGFTHFYDALYVKWKNIETNATSQQLVYATYHYSLIQGLTDVINVGPFTLNMPAPSFQSGASTNIPCYITTPVTISLSPYINTEANGIDQGETITSHFEWTLPSGWQTTSGQTGTFVGLSSISVIPPSSSSSASISLRAKANLQYSGSTVLQITRNLNSFSITGQTNVVYNSTYTYTVPSYSGISYSWQLPNGWSGSSTSNSIDVTVGCGSGNIVATMNGCNDSKSSPIAVTQSIIASGTTISGSDFVCTSGTSFNVPGLATGETITWNSSSNLTLSNASSNYCTYSANSSGDGWIEATINATACGTSVTIPRKNVWAGVPVINYISGSNHVDAYGMAFYEAITPASMGVTYTWSVSPSGTVYPGGSGANVCFQGDGDYHVYVTATNTCGSSSTADLFVGVGTYEPYIIYPNPGNDNVTLQVSQTGTTQTSSSMTEKQKKLDTYEVKIFNERGTLMKTQKTNNLPLTIPSRNLPEGKYILQVTNNGKTWNKQLIIKH